MGIDEIQPDEAGSRPTTTPTEDLPKSRHALSRVNLELSDEELSQPGVQKLLLDRIFRAEEENTKLRSIGEKFHESDKQNGILSEKLKTSTAAEVISMGTVALGGVALGYVHSGWASQPTGWIALALGAVLIGIGITAKVVRR